MRPYQPESNEDGRYGGENDSTHCRVLSCSFTPDLDAASFFAMIDANGQVVDFLRLKHLLWRRNSRKESERVNKVINFYSGMYKMCYSIFLFVLQEIYP